MIQETIVNLESCGVWFQNILPPPSDLARGAATDHADQVGRSQGWG